MRLDSLPTSRLFNLESNTLATKKKPTNKKGADESTTVTRITATDTKAKTKTTKTETAPTDKKEIQTNTSEESSSFGRLATPFTALGRYFKGAWYELRQVRWPNRKATWSLTAAVIAFTAFFAALILLLDALFKYLFQLILG